MSRLAAGFYWFPFFRRCARFSTGRVCTEGRYVILSDFPRPVNSGTGMEAWPEASEQDAPQGVRAQGTRAERGQADRGTGAAGRQYHPWPRSKSPERKRRVATNERSEIRGEGCRLCRPAVPQSGTVVTPSYALEWFSRFFSILCRKHRFAKAFIAFRWPTCRFFSGPLVGHVGHVRRFPMALNTLLGPPP